MTIQQLEDKYAKTTPSTVNDFITDVRSCVTSRSIHSLQLLGVLDRIINNFIPKAQVLSDSGLSVEDTDLDEVFMYAKILCAQILILQRTRSYRELSEKILLLLEWCSTFGAKQENVATVAIRCLSRQCTDSGLTWDVIRNAMSINFLAYHIIERGVFNGAEFPTLLYNGKGSISIEKGVLHISSIPGWASGAKAWDGCGSALMVHTKNAREEKLKASYINNAEQLATFAKTFIDMQNSSSASRIREVREAKVGDKVALKCEEVGYEEQSPIKVSALQTTLDRKGYIINEELVKGIWTEDLHRYIFDDDCIKDAVIVNLDDEPEFSIKECYCAFAKKKAEDDLRKGVLFEAVATYIATEYGRVYWMTAGGYGAISLMIEGVKVGSKMVMSVKNIQPGNFINIEQPKYGYDHIDRIFDEEQVLTEFLCSEQTVIKELEEDAEKTPEDKLAKERTLRSLSRIILHDYNDSSIERYRMRLSALFISTCIGDSAGMKLATEETSYMAQLLCYAQGTPLRLNTLSDSISPERKNILGCLAIQQSGTMKDIIPMLSNTDSSAKIASLIAAKFTSCDFFDEVKADDDSVRRRICKLLGVEDSFVESGDAATGKYGSTENRNLEFKSSYVFRNDNGEPDLIHQGRDQVFEAVCGFLNKDGGTVYVGVNNSGDPILSENSGVNGDMVWFRNNFSTLLPKRMRQLGHGTPLPDTLDHYALFLSQEKELYFSDTLLDKITIEPTDDEDAIRITVRPSLYEIAYLYEDETHTKGIAYVRDAGSTLPMTEKQKEERLMNQKLISKEVQFAVILQQACDQQRKVILKDYHSGNSGEIRDRLVVPINLFYNDENVLCYDLESHCEKQFRLARITSIDTDIPDPHYPHSFQKKTADVFRWIGDEDYHIKVRMEVGAYNYLIEEYSMAKKLPASELYMREDGHWILDTRLHGLGAIRRFYLGLADKIEILDTEDSDKLKEDIRKYKEEYLTE